MTERLTVGEIIHSINGSMVQLGDFASLTISYFKEKSDGLFSRDDVMHAFDTTIAKMDAMKQKLDLLLKHFPQPTYNAHFDKFRTPASKTLVINARASTRELRTKRKRSHEAHACARRVRKNRNKNGGAW